MEPYIQGYQSDGKEHSSFNRQRGKWYVVDTRNETVLFSHWDLDLVMLRIQVEGIKVGWTMDVVCCECGIKYGEKLAEMPGMVSHGYCFECHAKVMAELENFKIDKLIK